MKKQKKILFDYQIFSAQKYGGVSRYHTELYKIINKKSNWKCEIPIIFSRNEYLKEEYGIWSINKVSKIFRIVNMMYTLIRNVFWPYDIVHPTWYSQYVYKNNFFKKSKIVITIHDMCQEIYEHDELKHEIALKKAHILKSDLIIAVSENTKNDILHFYPVVDPEKIKVIYEAPVKIDNVKEISGLPDKYILYVGQREKYKNFLFFIDSICDLLKEDKDLYVVCLGPECSENENNTFEKLGISNKVKFFKINDEELNFAYQNARCMVYPSLYEGFGLPVLEAMQNGCPCVISNTSSLPEVGGNAAMYFDPTNKIDINEKVNKMLNDKSLNIKYSKMGLERVKDFSWEKATAQLLKEYDNILR